jgi:hypothetical protein
MAEVGERSRSDRPSMGESGIGQSEVCYRSGANIVGVTAKHVQ